MSGMFGSAASARPETYAGMQVSTSLMGQVIPYIGGRTRINSNLVWYGNFQQHGSGSSGKGGGAPSSYSFSAAWIAVLCLGPITGVYQVFHDRSLVSLAYENLSLALGGIGQPTWSGYPSGTPAVQQIPYSNLAYVATPAYNFGSSPSMPNLTYEVEAGGIVKGYSDAHGMYDADCSTVVTDYLTNAVTGAGFLGTINAGLLTGPTNTFQAYCMSLGILVSPYENNQRAATDFIKELMQITNSDIVLSCGVLKVIPYADVAVSGTTADGAAWSYTPNLTPLFSFGDGDFCPRTDNQGRPTEEPVILKRKALRDTYNIVNVEYLDRSNYYNPSPASASDNWDISRRGPRCMATVTLHQITSATVAKQAAQLILNWQLYERNTYVFRVRSDYWPLEPMDLIAITDAGLKLTNQVCRITEITEDKDFFLTLTVMEVPGTIRNTPQYNWSASQGYVANFDAAPGSVLAPAIFAMPPIAAAASSGITIGIAVCGPSGSAFWGGCNAYASIDGGTTYNYVGQVATNGPARYGTLTANLPNTPDPDTTSTLSVALSNTTLQLSTAVTHAEADSVQTLLLVGSGSTVEVMSYGAGSLVSAGNYNLSYLRRGLYQTQPHAQTTGAPFVRLDGSIFTLPVDLGMAGTTIYFKFCSFNSVGRAVEALSSVTAYPYTIPANFGGPAANSPTWLSSGTCAMSSPTSAFKLTSGASAWDSSIYSAQSFTNGCSASCYAGQANSTAALMFGLTTNPSASNNFTNLNYAFYATSGGSPLQIYVGGSPVLTVGSYTTSTLLNIVHDGKHVAYYVNGVMVYSVPATGLTLYVQICFNAPGNSVYGLDFSPVATAVTPFTLVPLATTVAAAGTRVISNGTGATGWGTKNFQSKESYSNGCVASASVNPALGGLFFGLAKAPATGDTTGLAIAIAGWLPHPDSSDVEILFNGANLGSFGATPSASDVFTLAYDNFNFFWYRNNTLILQKPYPNAGPLYLFGDFYEVNLGFANLTFQPYSPSTPQQFIARGNCTVSDTNVSKVGGSGVWDSDVYSIMGFQTCHAVWKANDTTSSFCIAFTQNIPSSPATPSSATLDFVFYCDAGTIEFYENGTHFTPAVTYTVADYFSLTYDGSTITYAKNGTAIRTFPTSGKTFFLAGEFFQPGAGCNSLEFGPSATIPIMDTPQIGLNATSVIASNFVATTVTADTTSASPTSATVLSLTITSTASPGNIDLSGTITYGSPVGGSGTVTVQILRDGSALPSGGIFTSGVTAGNPVIAMPFSIIASDTSPVGSHTYSCVITAAGPVGKTSPTTISLANTYLKYREIKR